MTRLVGRAIRASRSHLYSDGLAYSDFPRCLDDSDTRFHELIALDSDVVSEP